MLCPECNRTVPEGKNRCMYCGHKLATTRVKKKAIRPDIKKKSQKPASKGTKNQENPSRKATGRKSTGIPGQIPGKPPIKPPAKPPIKPSSQPPKKQMAKKPGPLDYIIMNGRTYVNIDDLSKWLPEQVKKSMTHDGVTPETISRSKAVPPPKPEKVMPQQPANQLASQSFTDKLDPETGLPPGVNSMEEYIAMQFSMMKSEPTSKPSQLRLVLILFSSLAIVGSVIWLLS